MGEAKRKRLSIDTEWPRLYPGLPARCAKIGLDHLFAFKRGSSGILKTATDPKGLHSWVEVHGWSIDWANGGKGQPVLVVPIDEYYGFTRMTDICDIEWEAATL